MINNKQMKGKKQLNYQDQFREINLIYKFLEILLMNIKIKII